MAEEPLKIQADMLYKVMQKSLRPLESSLSHISKSLTTQSVENQLESKRAQKLSLQNELKQTKLFEVIAGGFKMQKALAKGAGSAIKTTGKVAGGIFGFLKDHWGKILSGLGLTALLTLDAKTLMTAANSVLKAVQGFPETWKEWKEKFNDPEWQEKTLKKYGGWIAAGLLAYLIGPYATSWIGYTIGGAIGGAVLTYLIKNKKNIPVDPDTTKNKKQTQPETEDQKKRRLQDEKRIKQAQETLEREKTARRIKLEEEARLKLEEEARLKAEEKRIKAEQRRAKIKKVQQKVTQIFDSGKERVKGFLDSAKKSSQSFKTKIIPKIQEAIKASEGLKAGLKKGGTFGLKAIAKYAVPLNYVDHLYEQMSGNRTNFLGAILSDAPLIEKDVIEKKSLKDASKTAAIRTTKDFTDVSTSEESKHADSVAEANKIDKSGMTMRKLGTIGRDSMSYSDFENYVGKVGEAAGKGFDSAKEKVSGFFSGLFGSDSPDPKESGAQPVSKERKWNSVGIDSAVSDKNMAGTNWSVLGGLEKITNGILSVWNSENITGAPVFTSGKRSKDVNDKSGGVKHSQHLGGTAFDLRNKYIPIEDRDKVFSKLETAFGSQIKGVRHKELDGTKYQHFHFQKAAEGFFGKVTSPTLFLTGEAGDEWVNIVPKNSPNSKMDNMNRLQSELAMSSMGGSSPVTIVNNTSSNSSSSPTAAIIPQQVRSKPYVG